jgi:hypothetical protein
MPTFRSTVHHGGLRPDELVEIADDEVPRWAGEIKLGFLVPVDWDAHSAIRTFDDEDDDEPEMSEAELFEAERQFNSDAASTDAE